MRKLWFVTVAAVIAVWQLDMAVQAGIAASRRPRRPVVSRPAAPAPSCPGGQCQVPQPKAPTVTR